MLLLLILFSINIIIPITYEPRRDLKKLDSAFASSIMFSIMQIIIHMKNDVPFTIKEFNIAICNLKDNKAPGTDFIPTQNVNSPQLEFKENSLKVIIKLYETRQ